jgi:hypothetical protein
VVFQLSTPEFAPLGPNDEASAVELLADLLLKAIRDGAGIPSAGPALIEQEEEAG